MKTSSSKVFASCVAIVCLASVANALPVQKSVAATTENPIVEKHGCRAHKNLVRQNVVDLKTYDSMLITNEVVQKQSNEVQSSEQSNEGQNSEQSNEGQNSEQSNEGQL
uniref:ACYPI005168 protein n=1 Tax=Acyrthosiphon pisum TaxID=7029 RepID=C4WUZ8_ACYPI|nr:ACYPI005168 [Acyrthosiphon pisum]